ncbi:MAG: hypothetical protein OXL40_13590 [Bacteroidota bacterium]|nr:hypothetical protein [Bacteroidota bacterium]
MRYPRDIRISGAALQAAGGHRLEEFVGQRNIHDPVLESHGDRDGNLPLVEPVIFGVQSLNPSTDQPLHSLRLFVHDIHAV